MLESLIGAAVALATELLRRSRDEARDLGPQAVDALTAAKEMVRALGLESQALHSQLASLDLRSPEVEKEIDALRGRTALYLDKDPMTNVLRDAHGRLLELRNEFGRRAESWRRFGRRKAYATVDRRLTRVIEDLDNFDDRYLKFRADGTGLGLETLKSNRELLDGGLWRDDPQGAQRRWVANNKDFKKSDDYRSWVRLSSQIGRAVEGVKIAL